MKLKFVSTLMGLLLFAGFTVAVSSAAVIADVATADTAEAQTNYSGLVNVRATMGWNGPSRVVIVEGWTDAGFSFYGGRLYGLTNSGNASNICSSTYCRTVVNVAYWQSCGGVEGFYSGSIREGSRNPVYYLSPKVNAC